MKMLMKSKEKVYKILEAVWVMNTKRVLSISDLTP